MQKTEKIKYIKKIIKQQKIEELRYPFYTESVKPHGKEISWIYASTTLYVNDMIFSEDEDEEEDINIINHSLKQFELSLQWYDTPRIELWKEHLISILVKKKRYVSYLEYSKYLEDLLDQDHEDIEDLDKDIDKDKWVLEYNIDVSLLSLPSLLRKSKL